MANKTKGEKLTKAEKQKHADFLQSRGAKKADAELAALLNDANATAQEIEDSLRLWALKLPKA